MRQGCCTGASKSKVLLARLSEGLLIRVCRENDLAGVRVLDGHGDDIRCRCGGFCEFREIELESDPSSRLFMMRRVARPVFLVQR